MAGKIKHILVELKGHLPFTALGAVFGIGLMLLFINIRGQAPHILFSIFHPAHVLLSAVVTASMFRLHAVKKNFIIVLIIGYLGSIGIATLSDIIIPHTGSNLLHLDIPTHSEIHQVLHNHEGDNQDITNEDTEDDIHSHTKDKIHLGFIEEWYIVNPAAVLGVLIAYFLPHTKFPHAGHVLISTWASSSYLLMRMVTEITPAAAAGIFVIIFLSVWIPCCISDIVFPLLFVKSDIELAGLCPVHSRHSHPHQHIEQEIKR